MKSVLRPLIAASAVLLAVGLSACGSGPEMESGRDASGPASFTPNQTTPQVDASVAAPAGEAIAPDALVWPESAGNWTNSVPAQVINMSSSAVYENSQSGSTATVKYDSELLAPYETQVEAAQLGQVQESGSITCGISGVGSGDAAMCFAPIGQGIASLTMTSNADVAELSALATALVDANS